MEKPKIIIADTDESYVIPLLNKFVEGLFDNVDFEIITDAGYFEEYCCTPHTASILIVDEQLYNSLVFRNQDIKNIFVLVSEKEDGSTTDLGVERIKKYTTTEDIYNAVINKSGLYLTLKNVNKKATKVIVFYSACGGVGKTTLAMGASSCLANEYNRVLYLNAANLQTFGYLLKDKTPIIDIGAYIKLGQGYENIYKTLKPFIRNEGFSYLPPFSDSLSQRNLKFTIYEKFIDDAKKSDEYDYIIVDTEPTYDDFKAKLLKLADNVVVVTKATASALYATNLLTKNIINVKDNKNNFICNDYNEAQAHILDEKRASLNFNLFTKVYHINDCDCLSPNAIAEEKEIKGFVAMIK